MMIESALGILAASLLGSVHCAGMCGAFVCFYTGSAPTSTQSRGSHVSASARSGASASASASLNTPAGMYAYTRAEKPSMLMAHGMYNLGRLQTYLLLGALAGTFGAGVTQASALAGLANGAAVLAGVLMIAWGTYRIATLSGFRMPWMASGPVVLALQQALGSVLLRVQTQPVSMRAFLTGVITTLLPCGWLYVFVVAAGGTGSAGQGMLLMFVFWLGNVPALLAVAAGAQRAFGSLQRTLPAVSAVVVVALGLISVIGHLQMGSMDLAHVR